MAKRTKSTVAGAPSKAGRRQPAAPSDRPDLSSKLQVFGWMMAIYLMLAACLLWSGMYWKWVAQLTALYVLFLACCLSGRR
jgi:hypothetical protein